MALSSVTDAQRGAAVYSTWKIHIYDMLVLGFVNTWAWRCPTAKYLLPLFKSNIGSKHLDIGVGTGYYLQYGEIPASTILTLCDLNPTALKMAKHRDQVRLHLHVFLVALFPGPVGNKTVVFDHLKHNLTPDGVVTGATVLGKGVTDNWVGRYVRRFCEYDGIMDNRTDDAVSFIRSLKNSFDVVEAEVVGVVLVFKATKPKV